MTPREQLDRETKIILHGMCRDRHGAANAISQNLNNYAIGRWVPVEERLPEFDHINRWGGCVLWKDDGKPTFGDWVRPHFNGHYFTHWLDLDTEREGGSVMLVAKEVENLQRPENSEWDIEQAQAMKVSLNTLIWQNAPASTTLGEADKMACFFLECIAEGRLKPNEKGE